jgi:hypothetical protein
VGSGPPDQREPDPADQPEARRRRLLVQVTLLGLLIVATEGGLRAAGSYRVPGSDRWHENAERYGLGYGPRATITLRDPDTGALIEEQASGEGYRDADRAPGAHPGTLRLLAIGDHGTFGHTVQRQAMWTVVLERRLRELGVEAEVVNLSDPSWGADHELEALRKQGLALEPDLVLLQPSGDDVRLLSERHAPQHWLRPFEYALGIDGALERRTVEVARPGWLVTRVVQRSELLKRMWFSGGGRSDLPPNQPPPLGGARRVTTQAISHLEGVLGERAAGLVKALWPRMGRVVGDEELAELLAAHGLGADAEVVGRLLEDHHHNEHFDPDHYRPGQRELPPGRWELWRAVLGATASAAAPRPVGVVLDDEVTRYAWLRSWASIDPDPRYQAPAARFTTELRRFAAERGLGVVEPVVPVTRSRNDSAPDAAGHAATAENVLRWLQGAHGPLLERHRRP